MKTKSLVKSMIWSEAQRYTLDHPEWEIPTAPKAMEIDPEDCDWDTFWIQETLADRRLIYSKKKQCFMMSHPNIKRHVVLVERNQ